MFEEPGSPLKQRIQTALKYKKEKSDEMLQEYDDDDMDEIE